LGNYNPLFASYNRNIEFHGEPIPVAVVYQGKVSQRGHMALPLNTAEGERA